MSVNGVTNHAAARGYEHQADYSRKKEPNEAKPADSTASDSGAIYEPSKRTRGKAKGQTKVDAQTIANVKADNEARKAQLIELVQKMLKGQAKTHGKSKSKAYDFNAKPSQAASAISADGYWGVDQTSKRILDFATAYAGDDPKKLDEMRAAFEKGYRMAERAWGGKLPDVCRRTYDAIMAGFDELKAGGSRPSNGSGTESVNTNVPSYLRDAERAARIKAAVDAEAAKIQTNQLTSFVRQIADTIDYLQKRTDAGDVEAEKALGEILGNQGYGSNSALRLIYDRVDNYAKGDVRKIDEMKAAIEKGIDEASETRNGELPAGLTMTYNDLMMSLDWMKENSSKIA